MLKTPPPVAFQTYAITMGNFGCSLAPALEKLRINSSYATARFVQLFATSTVPANGSVPIMPAVSMAALQRNLELDLGPHMQALIGTGLTAVASSTEATLTKDTSATMDFMFEVEEWERSTPAGTLVAGDFSTARASLTVWNDASGPKKLFRAHLLNTTGADMYACLYAENTPDSGSRIVSWIKIPAGARTEWNFGSAEGISPYQQDPDGTAHDACVIAAQVNLTPGNVTGSNDFYIRAEYL
jgi:hypothetical protein